MQRVATMQEGFLARQRDQNNLLEEAQNKSQVVLDTLVGVATASETLASIMTNRLSWVSWGPYMWCPIVSLTLGSYGLPPSPQRNLVLIAIGTFPS
jgi:hypothetical protein